jgi:hypothetical protein
MSHVHARDPICPRMLATTLRRDSDLANSSDKGHFSELLHRPANMFWCARSEVVRDNLGHVECRRDPGCTTSDEGRTVTLESPLQTWIEDKQCAFTPWFLQLL